MVYDATYASKIWTPLKFISFTKFTSKMNF